MHSLTTAYTVCFNLRHRRHGHLLDGRFKAKLVDGDEYLLALTRYVHLNPVCVGSIKKRPIKERIQRLRKYEWSTYQSYIGKAKPFDFVTYAPVLAEMTGRKKDRPKRYREYVETGLAEDDEDFKIALKESPRSIGTDAFRSWVDELYQNMLDGQNRPEDASFRHITEPLDPDRVMEVVAEALGAGVEDLKQRRRNSVLRAVAARCLCRYAGLTQREVADGLEVGTGAAISRQIRKLSAQLPRDHALKRKLQKAERRLSEMQAAQSAKSVKY